MEIFLLGLVAFSIMVLFGARVLAVLVLLPVVVWVMIALYVVVIVEPRQRERDAAAPPVAVNLPAVEKPIPFRPIPPAWWSQ